MSYFCGVVWIDPDDNTQRTSAEVAMKACSRDAAWAHLLFCVSQLAADNGISSSWEVLELYVDTSSRMN